MYGIRRVWMIFMCDRTSEVGYITSDFFLTVGIFGPFRGEWAGCFECNLFRGMCKGRPPPPILQSAPVAKIPSSIPAGESKVVVVSVFWFWGRLEGRHWQSMETSEPGERFPVTGKWVSMKGSVIGWVNVTETKWMNSHFPRGISTTRVSSARKFGR